MAILIKKVSEPHGWLGNMSPYPIVYNNQEYKTSEALFQCLRFNDLETINLIKSQKSPMAVKMVAKKHKNLMVIRPQSDEDINNMRMVLNLKISQYPDLKEKLLKTTGEEIIEDCTKRPKGSGLFWGAALRNKDGSVYWEGENWLGRLWMEIRSEAN